ncbi:Cdx3 [Aphelenchoides besseyi]|nr:Cdx3 [Aphelenchoides besseyi]
MKRSNLTDGVMKKRRLPLLKFNSHGMTDASEPQNFPVLSSDSSESCNESEVANNETMMYESLTEDQKIAKVDDKRTITMKPPTIRPVRRSEAFLPTDSFSNTNIQNPYYREATADDRMKIREIADKCKDLRLVLGITEDVLVRSMNYLCRTMFTVSTLSQFENKQLTIEKMEEVKIPLEYWYRKLEYDLRMGKTLREFLRKYAGEPNQSSSINVAAAEKRSNYQILSEQQKQALTAEYAKNSHVDVQRRAELSKQMNLDEKKIYTWFWNRRMHDRIRVSKQMKTPSIENNASLFPDVF